MGIPNIEYWVTILGLVLTNVVSLYTSIAARKTNAPLVNAQAQGELSKAYSLLLTSYAPMTEELKQLRPLVLKIQMLEVDRDHEKQEKREWRNYATRLLAQMKAAGIAPEPFQQMPEDTDPKINSSKSS